MGNKDCHEFRFSVVRIVISVTSLSDCSLRVFSKRRPPPPKKFFRTLPELPLSPQFGQLEPLFQTSKTTFNAYDRKNTNDDNDGCNANYDGHFDDNDDKNYQKNIQISWLLSKNVPILGTITLLKKKLTLEMDILTITMIKHDS